LQLVLEIRGGLRPVAGGDGRAVRFLDESGGTCLSYSGLRAWDSGGRDLGARFLAEGTSIRVVVDDQEARYPVMIDPIASQAYLKAAASGAGDRFGAGRLR
jgi:hypothetical protein